MSVRKPKLVEQLRQSFGDRSKTTHIESGKVEGTLSLGELDNMHKQFKALDPDKPARFALAEGIFHSNKGDCHFRLVEYENGEREFDCIFDGAKVLNAESQIEEALAELAISRSQTKIIS